MIEIRTYDGDAAEIAAFTKRVWRATYEGRMPLPLWDHAYFDWQLLAGCDDRRVRPGGRDYLVAAYDGAKLVGSLFGEAFRFRLHQRQVDATMGSWLTVDPEYRRQGIGSRLFDEQRRRHRERGGVFHLGFGYTGYADSLGPRFWKSFPESTVVLGKVGFWARVLDHRAEARWNLSRLERVGTRALALVQSRHPKPESLEGIRPYRPSDLADCLALARGLLDEVDLGYVWSEGRLAHQLWYQDVPRTLVLEHAGRVGGFVNYYHLDYLGRGHLSVAMIDLLAFGDVPSGLRMRLLRAALAQMVEQGAQMALLLRLPCYPKRPVLQAGFIPMPRDFLFVCVRMDPEFSLDGAKRLHVHWR
jgi:GNAT superfamily N-acetyltransferase